MTRTKNGAGPIMAELAMLSVTLSLEDPNQARVVTRAANEIAALRLEMEGLRARLAKLELYEATLIAYNDAINRFEFLNALRSDAAIAIETEGQDGETRLGAKHESAAIAKKDTA